MFSGKQFHAMTMAAAGVIVAAMANVVAAAPIINVGSHTLTANTPNQKVQIFVSGDAAVDGVNFFVATGDGGEAVGGTANSAPAITGLVLNGPGMLFATRPQATPDQTPQFFSASANTAAPVTTAAGTLLAELTIDTTGYAAGTSYPLVLDFTPVSGLPDTTFTLAGNELAATITNGTINLVAVPEPTLIAAAALLAPALRRRRRA